MAKDTSALREIRTRLGLSQAECATALGVALETFRAWDAGRRTAPEAIVTQARRLRVKRQSHDRMPLQVLADELNVHVRTLRAAAHDGRLAATFGPRPFFGKITATATREAGAQFMARWYRRTYGRGRRRLVDQHCLQLGRARRRPRRTDQNKDSGLDGLGFFLLGLFGEVGTLLSALKKKQRDRESFVGYGEMRAVPWSKAGWWAFREGSGGKSRYFRSFTA